MSELIDEGKLSKAINTGLDQLIVIMKEDKPTKEQFTQARLAASMAGIGTRYLATKSATHSLNYRIAMTILKSQKERKEYLAVSSPSLKLLK